MFVMISYDIVDNAKRLKLMKFLKEHGTRVQKSVFECHLDPGTYDLVKERIEEIIDKRKDRVRYYRICNGCVEKIDISGWGEITEDEEFVIV